MYFPLVILVFIVGQVLAFSLTVGNRAIDVSDILNIPDSPVKTACNANCTSSIDSIATCSNDPACLCSVDIVASLFSCQTCMLHHLIAQNVPAPDFRAGSNVIMGAYIAACKAEIGAILPAGLSALTLPDTWDGPFVAVLPVAATVAYATFGGVLAFAALYILSNI